MFTRIALDLYKTGWVDFLITPGVDGMGSNLDTIEILIGLVARLKRISLNYGC